MKINCAKHTLAELKREAKSGTLKLELTYRFGEEIPERLKGIRQVKGRSNSIIMVNGKGEESYLWFTCANLVDYDGQTLTIYSPGVRDLTAEEKLWFEKGKEEQDRYQKENPYTDSFWHMRGWWKETPCPWLDRYNGNPGKKIRGKRLGYVNYEPKIFDDSIKGKKDLAYKVHHVISLCV